MHQKSRIKSKIEKMKKKNFFQNFDQNGFFEIAVIFSHQLSSTLPKNNMM